MAKEKDSFGKLTVLGIQHVFAMFGATVLVPALTGLSPAVALLAAGLGTWLFHLVTKRKVPVFLGSSFAFIGAIIASAMMKSGLSPERIEELGDALIKDPSYVEALPYAMGGIIVAGALYLVLALLVYLFGVKRVKSFFPPIVTGPIIIIIGMMLAPTAIQNVTGATMLGEPINAGISWGVAAITVLSIILVTRFARGFFKLVPILIGIVVGYIAAICFGIVDFQPIADAQWIQMPNVFLPKFDWTVIALVAPIAIVTFVEHIGDVTASSAVIGRDLMKDPGLHRTLMGDGLATMLAGFIGGPANTTYSENTGVLAATRNYNPVTLQIAATFAILLAFVGKLGAFLLTLPGPVMGGVSIVLFGMIAAVGLRQLVEHHVDFKDSRNLLIAAVMLVLGLGANNAISFGGVAISGVALAAVLGIILNKALPEKMDTETHIPDEVENQE